METNVLIPCELSLQEDCTGAVTVVTNNTVAKGAVFGPSSGTVRNDYIFPSRPLHPHDPRHALGSYDSLREGAQGPTRHCNWVRFLHVSPHFSPEVNVVASWSSTACPAASSAHPAAGALPKPGGRSSWREACQGCGAGNSSSSGGGGVNARGCIVFVITRTLGPDTELIAHFLPLDTLPQHRQQHQEHSHSQYASSTTSTPSPSTTSANSIFFKTTISSSVSAPHLWSIRDFLSGKSPPKRRHDRITTSERLRRGRTPPPASSPLPPNFTQRRPDREYLCTDGRGEESRVGTGRRLPSNHPFALASLYRRNIDSIMTDGPLDLSQSLVARSSPGGGSSVGDSDERRSVSSESSVSSVSSLSSLGSLSSGTFPSVEALPGRLQTDSPALLLEGVSMIDMKVTPENVAAGTGGGEAPLGGAVSAGAAARRGRERSILPCPMCGKSFDRPSLLKRHMRTHTGEKPHTCEVCGKGFSTSSSLNTHRRIHSGEKPHQCRVCGKRFTASSNLYYHKMTHVKEKPHKCSACPRSFPTPGDLRAHMFAHTGMWPHRCPVCTKGFSKPTNLRNHLALHSAAMPRSQTEDGESCQLMLPLQ